MKQSTREKLSKDYQALTAALTDLITEDTAEDDPIMDAQDLVLEFGDRLRAAFAEEGVSLPYATTDIKDLVHHGLETSPNVVISHEQFIEFMRTDAELVALQSGGVDNWSWYDESMTEYFEQLEKWGIEP